MDNTNFTLFETLSDADGYKINIPWVGYILENLLVLYCNNLYKQIKIEDDYAIITDANNILKYTANAKLSSDLGEILHIYDPETKLGMYIFEQDLINIPSSAFSNNLDLTDIIIPNSVTQINDSAFYKCTNLTSVTMSSGITNIGFWTFGYCTSLTGIITLEKPASMSYGAFQGCSSITGIVIKDANNVNNVECTIGLCAFEGCTSLATAIIGRGIVRIGQEAFKDCINLNNLVLPDSLILLDMAAFNNCSSLTTVNLPDSATNISKYGVFGNCTGLTSPIYNTSLFVRLPQSYSGNYIIPSGITTIVGYSCLDCSDVTGITIPDTVTNIGTYGFGNCTNLSNVIIPDNVTVINNYAFGGSGLTSVTIGSGVTNIGGAAFRDCRSLTNITYNGTMSQWNLISKGNYWHTNVPATVAHCSDGDVNL